MRLRVTFLLIPIFVYHVLLCRDVLVEFKGAYFLSTSSRFKNCFKGSALYGPELTIQLLEQKNWYCFASVDYFKQEGRFLSLCDSTKLRLLMLALGIKYFVPFEYGDFYVGLGFQADYFNKKNSNKCVTLKKISWGFGGRGKIGTYIHLPHNFFLNLFCEYSFVWTKKNNFYGNRTTCLRINGSGAIFGAGLGYKF